MVGSVCDHGHVWSAYIPMSAYRVATICYMVKMLQSFTMVEELALPTSVYCLSLCVSLLAGAANEHYLLASLSSVDRPEHVGQSTRLMSSGYSRNKCALAPSKLEVSLSTC